MATANVCSEIVNELLTYAIHYLNSSTIENIKKVVQQFYSDDDILDAKKLLWESRSEILGQFPERKSTKSRNAASANTIDIFEALIKLDAQGKLPNVVAKNIDKIPNRQPEELNLLYVVQRLANLEKSRDEQNETMTNLAIDILKLKEDKSQSTIQQSSDNSPYKSALINTRQPQPLPPHTAATADRHAPADTNMSEDGEGLRVSEDGNEVILLQKIIKEQDKEMKKSLHNQQKSEYQYHETRSSMPPPSRPAPRGRRRGSGFWAAPSRAGGAEGSSRESSGERGAAGVFPGRGTLNIRGRGSSRGRGGQWNTGPARHHGGARPKDPPSVDSEGYTLVKPRRQATGRRTTPTPGLEGAPPPTKPIFVYRVKCGDTELIKKYIEENEVTVHEITKISHDDAKFNSFKVYVYKNELDKVFDDFFWPTGVHCKIWWDRDRLKNKPNIRENEENSSEDT